jgi:hypothetical protein
MPDLLLIENRDGISRPIVDVGTTRLIDEDAMSPRSLLQAQRWLNECITRHKRCEFLTGMKLPPRVLKVGSGGDEVHLFQSLESRDEYATLSYCSKPSNASAFFHTDGSYGKGGTSRPYSLDSATLKDLLNGAPIHIVDLPKTFQDAITVTRHLGIPYLWIDSLCIGQDSNRDRLEALDLMKNIYGNAILNISANHGVDPTIGLSSDRRAFAAAKEIRPGVYVRRTLSIPALWEPSHAEDRTEHVLSTRAWVLQERALSSRVLHFSANELAFECDTKVQCECSSIFKPADLRPSRTMFRKFKYNSDPDTWSNLVQLYTELKLGRQGDALDAISGLSSKMGSITGKVYIAGLWKEDLPWNLLWFRDSGVPASGRSSERVHFPSWSWASVDGKICMFKNPYPETNGQLEHTSYFESCLEIDQSNMRCENDYTSAYLNVRSHTLRVYGRKVEISVPYQHSEQTLAEYFAAYMSDKMKLPKIKGAFTNFDKADGPYKIAGKTCYLLLTGTMDAVYFLILRKVKTEPIPGLDDGGDYYQRIGRFGCLVDAADQPKLREIQRKLVLLI